MVKLIAYRLRSYDHPALIEQLRVLYNGAVPFLKTHPISEQTILQQQEWWKKLDHSRVTVHLYSPVDWPWHIVAFSMVTDRGSFCSPMFAISPFWWGMGYGSEIIEHYLSIAAGKPLRGEQLVSNKAICHLNQKMGWTVVSERNGTQFLLHKNATDRQQECYDEIMRYNEEGP